MSDQELILRFDSPPPRYFVAVCKHGCEGHELPAMAIWRMHEHVPANSKPVQVLLYETDGALPVEIKSDGTPVWPRRAKYRLAGITSTGRVFRQRPQ